MYRLLNRRLMVHNYFDWVFSIRLISLCTFRFSLTFDLIIILHAIIVLAGNTVESRPPTAPIIKVLSGLCHGVDEQLQRLILDIFLHRQNEDVRYICEGVSV